MANIKSSIKRARQNVKQREHNAALRSKLRTSIKRVRQAIERKQGPEAQEAFQHMQSFIDHMAGKGFIHPNKAARHKKRLNSKIKILLTQ